MRHFPYCGAHLAYARPSGVDGLNGTHGNPSSLDAGRAKWLARDWVVANAPHWPGLRAAHLTGGIMAMDDAAPFPAAKDVDLHLIVADDSPLLAEFGPGPRILEEHWRGIAIEAGVKTLSDYRSAAAVLANPEIAHHLLGEGILHDPDGLLAALQEAVRRDYPRRRWVHARLAHERRGQAGAFAMLPAMRAQWGGSGELNILGYTTTFAAAAMFVAALEAPRMGGRVMLHLGEILGRYGRRDLHEELLAILGLSNIAPVEVARFLREAAEGFDLAVALREESGLGAEFAPFQHKLHRHLREYFVGACREMLASGHHREAMGWVMPYHLATADVIRAAGPAAEGADFAARQRRLLQALDLETEAARDAAVARLHGLYDRIFTLADEIVATNPRVVD